MAKHVVTSWDEKIEITVAQKSKSVWIAVGNHIGRIVEVKGRSESTAIALWRDAARYRGN